MPGQYQRAVDAAIEIGIGCPDRVEGPEVVGSTGRIGGHEEIRRPKVEPPPAGGPPPAARLGTAPASWRPRPRPPEARTHCRRRRPHRREGCRRGSAAWQCRSAAPGNAVSATPPPTPTSSAKTNRVRHLDRSSARQRSQTRLKAQLPRCRRVRHATINPHRGRRHWWYQRHPRRGWRARPRRPAVAPKAPSKAPPGTLSVGPSDPMFRAAPRGGPATPMAPKKKTPEHRRGLSKVPEHVPERRAAGTPERRLGGVRDPGRSAPTRADRARFGHSGGRVIRRRVRSGSRSRRRRRRGVCRVSRNEGADRSLGGRCRRARCRGDRNRGCRTERR